MYYIHLNIYSFFKIYISLNRIYLYLGIGIKCMYHLDYTQSIRILYFFLYYFLVYEYSTE